METWYLHQYWTWAVLAVHKPHTHSLQWWLWRVGGAASLLNSMGSLFGEGNRCGRKTYGQLETHRREVSKHSVKKRSLCPLDSHCTGLTEAFCGVDWDRRRSCNWQRCVCFIRINCLGLEKSQLALNFSSLIVCVLEKLRRLDKTGMDASFWGYLSTRAVTSGIEFTK